MIIVCDIHIEYEVRYIEYMHIMPEFVIYVKLSMTLTTAVTATNLHISR